MQPLTLAAGQWAGLHNTRLVPVVLFYEILLVACTVVIAWFALYAVYRLISDDS